MGELVVLWPNVHAASAQEMPGMIGQSALDGLQMAVGAESVPIPMAATGSEATVTLLDTKPSDEGRIDITKEVYGSSLRIKRRLGRLAILDLLNTEEGEEARRADYGDWVTDLGEKMKTAESLKGIIEVNRVGVHEVRDNHVMAGDGKSRMDRLVEAGEDSSKQAVFQAETELEKRVMATQAERDGSDVYSVRRVDMIAAGELSVNSRTVVSMAPQEAMERDGVEVWEDMKYRKGLAYIQSYFFDGEFMHTLTFSVSYADKDQLRDVLNTLGFDIPEDAHTSDWVRYGLETNFEPDEIIGLLTNIRKEYYNKIGKEGMVMSVEEVLGYEETILMNAYEELNLPLAKSISSGVKDPKIQEFAEQILSGGNVLDDDLRRNLIRICNRKSFDAKAGRVIDELIKYSVVEALRESAINIAKSTGLWKEEESAYTAPNIIPQQVDEETVTTVPAGGSFIQRMGSRVLEGAKAGRDYGGCPGKQMRIAGKVTKAERQAMDPQDAYGGHNIEAEEDDEADSIPAQIRCIKCDKYSPREDVVHQEYWCCPWCKYKVDICSGDELHASSVDSEVGQEPTNNVISMADFKARYSRETAEEPTG